MTPDPTLPGIPNDAIDHAANVERADALLSRIGIGTNADDVEILAEALTAAELRGFAAGVASVKPVPATPKETT